MKAWQVIISVSGVAIVGLGITMAITNPDEPTYEEYAVNQLTKHLKSNCNEIPKVFDNNFLQQQCISLIDTGRPQIQQTIAANTKPQNFIFFSLYRTDLAINSFVPLPAYHFETVGAFNSFYTYQVKQK
jgi:hypothetical protein